MSYISNSTGLEVSELEHVKQSITDILTTRKKTRVMLMEYGTNLYQLLDQPVTRELISDVRMEIATAIDKWEPRVEVLKVTLDMTSLSDGVIIIDLKCRYKPTGEYVDFESLNIKYRSIET